MTTGAWMKRWPFVAYGSFLTILSLLTLRSAGRLNKAKLIGFRGDHLIHVLLFLPWMLMAGGRGDDPFSRPRFWGMFACGMMVAVSSEAVQVALPGRTFDLNDLAANGAGIAMGAVIAWSARRLKPADAPGGHPEE
jgi:hypothetical protein